MPGACMHGILICPNAAAQVLKNVLGDLTISGNPLLQTMKAAFPVCSCPLCPIEPARAQNPGINLPCMHACAQALRSALSLEVSYNPQLASLAGSFPQLQLVTNTAVLNITGNTGLKSLAGLEVGVACSGCRYCHIDQHPLSGCL